MRVLLATFGLLPDGETGGALLVDALAARGHEASWATWDDPDVDWAAADLVAVRSTWDYHRRLPDFLAWARAVEQRTHLLNGAETFAWNADKAYLTELAEVLAVVPTALLDDAGLVEGLRAAFERWGTVVVKPRTSAGGVGVCVVDRVDDQRLDGLTAGPWVVQPLVESVRTDGEISVFVLGGRATVQVDKLPSSTDSGEVRVHESYGGSSRVVPLDPALAAVAERAVAVVAERRGVDLTYARADLMRWQGEWVVSELELIEPGLYLEVAPEMAERFADVVDRAGPQG